MGHGSPWATATRFGADFSAPKAGLRLSLAPPDGEAPARSSADSRARQSHGTASVCTGRVAVAAKVGSPSAPTRRARAAGLRAASLPVWWWRVRTRISLSGGLVGLSTTRFAEQPRRLCHSRAARTHGTVAASLSQRGSLFSPLVWY